MRTSPLVTPPNESETWFQISLNMILWSGCSPMLRAVAFARAQETGERPSVSALIAAEQRKIKRELDKLKNQQLQIQSERSWQCLRSGTVC